MSTKALLNFNTIYKKKTKKHTSIDTLNKTISPLFKKPYEFIRYVGKGIQGDIYLCKLSSENKEYICKIIKVTADERTRVEREISTLDKIYSNNNTKFTYAIPCIEHIYHNNKIYAIFPVKTGYKLKNIYPILDAIYIRDKELYEKIILYIIRQIIKGLSEIHNKRVAHQNIDSSSIHISTNIKTIKDITDIKKLEVRFVDFGLSCDGSDCLSDMSYFMNSNNLQKSNTKQNNDIINKTLKKLNPSTELIMAQRYDIWCCGKLLYELLHYRDPKELSYINDDLANDRAWYNDFKLSHSLNSTATSPNLSKYNDFIEKWMLVPLAKRKTARYIINKILVFEKYLKSI
jgi:serine/threonine protein kinase